MSYYRGTGTPGTGTAASRPVRLDELAASDGSSLVGFIQSGTGAVATTVQAELRNAVWANAGRGVTTAAADNHDAILATVNYAYSLGGAAVFFPPGTFKTSPISFQGLTGVYLRGAGGSVPSISRTTLQIIGAGIGLQFSDTTNPTPSWHCSYSKVQGFYINCNNVGTIGINGAFGFEIDDVNVRNATSHGVQLESYTYPCYISKLKSSFNGGHGIYIRGPVTTKYSLSECEFSGNDLYGMCIDGGANSTFRDITCQANVTGGIKIYYPSSGAYLNGLLFDSVYTEGNGLIGSGNPGYEGDYALVVDSYDATSSVTKCASDLTFLSCKINKSTSGQAFNINRAYGFTFTETDLENYTLGTNCALGQYAYAGVYNGKHFTIGSDSSASLTDHLLNIYRHVGFPKGNIVNGMWLAKRGNVFCFTYTLASIAAATTVLMDTDISLRFPTLSKSYRMFGVGSVLGMAIHQVNLAGPPAGTLTIRPLLATAAAGLLTAPANTLSGSPSLVMTCNADLNKKVEYTVGAHPFTEMCCLGIEITSSAGYVASTGGAQIIVELYVEM